MYYGIKYKPIIKTIGALLCIEALFLLIPIAITLIYGEGDFIPFLITFIITAIIGSGMMLFTRKNRDKISKREGILTVTLCWISISLIGAIPFMLNGNVTTFTDAFFESVSGFTTTGMTILPNLDTTSHGILLWRSLTHWMGGMGIILFTLAILPMLNSGGGIQLFSAEMTGISCDKLVPRIGQTSKKLWMLYLGITLLLIVLLALGPMNLFDAACTALSTTSTGGYATKQDGLGYWQSAYVDYVVIFFMYISGINFALVYRSLFMRGTNIIKDEEFRLFTIIILSITILITAALLISNFYSGDIEYTVRSALFTVVSSITCSGFSITSYADWGTFSFILIVLGIFIGGSAGSTAGGLKVIRFLILIKNTAADFYRQIHPNAIRPVRVNNKVISSTLVSKVTIFVVVFIVLLVICSLLLSTQGMGLEEAVGVSISAMSNCGLGFGSTSSNFAMVTTTGKWIIICGMIIGRLEIFTVLILFTKYFWKK